MARITVEDCLEKIRSQYDLVLLAKERTSQLNAGDAPLLAKENDKNTVISLREIGEGKILVEDLEKSAVLRLRKEPDENLQQEETEEEENDEFENLYKGQVSKSGIAILPSKRTRKIPEVKKIAAIEKETEIKQEDIFVKKDAQVNENDTIGDDKPEAPATNEDPLTLKEEVTE